MSDRVVSLIRTVIPVWWGSILAWLVSLGLPDGIAEAAADLGPLLVGLTIAGWYAVARWLESRLPTWLVRVLFGSSRAPSYAAAPSSAGPATPDAVPTPAAAQPATVENGAQTTDPAPGADAAEGGSSMDGRAG
ncbi:hypothetical protein [Actinoalloteichus sp. GBA129-24]|uniref:hypothetical protein n=1 Tax=Actinoalloteichus sp. GBA129-24 TaxID=1612551 RepID=UPI0009507F37|nr:hypothetical protein [Actinoalloteichus sp. GBA129-24]APU22657.1 hypothetical protein UA75_23375 [Actinoalloteichus sp. GBA129-24]